MSTRFKNTSTGAWTDFYTIGTKWKFDTVGVTPKVIEGTLEYLICECATANPDKHGDISFSLEPLTCEFNASSATPDVTGYIDASLELLDVNFSGTFIENWISAELEKLICRGYANMGIECELEYLSCTMDSMFGAKIEATTDELEVVIMGNATYVSLEPFIAHLGIEMHAGASMGISIEEPLGTGLGYNEILANIKASLQRIIYESRPGYAINARISPLTFNALGDTEILGKLVIQTRNFVCELDATTEALSSIAASLRALSVSMTAESSTSKVNDLVAILSSPSVTIYAVSGYTGTIEGALQELTAELVASSPSVGDLNCILDRLTMEGLLFIDSNNDGLIDPCTPYKTIEFEGI